jgi:hypothetical protein
VRPPSLLSRLLDVVAAAGSSRTARAARRDGRTGSGGLLRRRTVPGPRPNHAPGPPNRPAPRSGTPATGASPYPGDFTGAFRPVYAPRLDGAADPGEIVWTWVPFEEDPSLGKDRPVLVVGRDGEWLLVLMLTSRDHDASPDHREEVWLDLGVGEWDARGRQSEVRIDRVVRIDPVKVRREGAVLDRERFGQVASALERVSRRRGR